MNRFDFFIPKISHPGSSIPIGYEYYLSYYYLDLFWEWNWCRFNDHMLQPEFRIQNSEFIAMCHDVNGSTRHDGTKTKLMVGGFLHNQGSCCQRRCSLP